MRSTAGRPPHPHPDEVEAIAVAVASGAPDVPMKIDKRTAPHDAKFVAFQAVIDLVVFRKGAYRSCTVESI